MNPRAMNPKAKPYAVGATSRWSISTNDDVEMNTSWPLNMSPITAANPTNAGVVNRTR